MLNNFWGLNWKKMWTLQNGKMTKSMKISRHSLIINKIIKRATLKSFLNQKDFSSNLFINVGMYIIFIIKCKFIYLPFMGNWSIGTLLKRR